MKKYEEEFIKEHSNCSPFFKKNNGKTRQNTFSPMQQHHQRTNKSSYADVAATRAPPAPSHNEPLQHLVNQLIETMNGQNQFRPPQRRGPPRQFRGNFGGNNFSNNSFNEENAPVMEPPVHSFRQEDHNWHNRV